LLNLKEHKWQGKKHEKTFEKKNEKIVGKKEK
jgi:hypothetical protein